MNEYYALSNASLATIMYYAVAGIVILWAVANYLGGRDARIDGQKKSIFRKVAPWGLLCVCISKLALFIYRVTFYPWFIEPQSSAASWAREELVGNDIVIYGWANAEQMLLIHAMEGTVLWLFWTVYAFSYKPSDIPLWKKICKVIAYILISMTIIGFAVHTSIDFLIWAVVFAVIIVLIILSKAKKAIQKDVADSVDEQQETKNKSKNSEAENKESDERFMPKTQKEQPVNDNVPGGILKDSTLEPASSQALETSILEESVSSSPVDKDVIASEDMDTPKETESKNEDTKFCKYCGKRIETDSLYCKYCGRKL